MNQAAQNVHLFNLHIDKLPCLSLIFLFSFDFWEISDFNLHLLKIINVVLSWTQ